MKFVNDKAHIFDVVLNTFENEDIKKLAEVLIDSTIPDYFFNVGASSTGKYHPQYALGDLGLARHTVALCRFMNHMFNLEMYQEKFTSRERDLMRLAGIMHDSRKSGDSTDYAINKYTKFDHPLLAADVVRRSTGAVDSITNEEIEICARAIEKHMGEWNTDKRSKIALPKPDDKYSAILHLCDYLASRKDIEVLFDAVPAAEPKNEEKIEEYRLTFGRYKGQLLMDVYKEHRDYVQWMKANLEMREPLKTFVNALV